MTAIDARPLRDVAQVIMEWPLIESGTRRVFRAIDGDDLLVNDFDSSGKNLGLTIRSLSRPGADTSVAGHGGVTEGILSADLNRQAVVWMESPGADLGVAPWLLYAFDRKSGATTKLAESGLVGGKLPPPVPGFTGPILHGGAVYWAEVSGKVGAETVDIQTCQLTRCVPQRAVRGAALPSVTGSFLYYVSGDRYLGDTAATDYRLERLNLDDGTKHVVRNLETSNATPTGLAASNNHVVVTADAGEYGWVDVFDVATDTKVRIETEPLGSFVYPKATARFAVWGEGNSGAESSVGGYLLDFDTDELYSVGDTAGLYKIEADGATIVWQESAGPKPEDITTVVGRVR